MGGMSLNPATTQELPMALDATSIGHNFTVLSINVLYRGSGIPVAWKVVKAREKGSWKPYWKELFQSLKNIVPTDWKVIVSADRGLYADWLYLLIVELGWHPFLRINHQGQYRPQNSSSWQLLSTVVTHTGESWSGQVTCFKSNPINATLLARWDDGYADPWLILTDLKSTDADVSWYGFRSWIECSYRDVKSDGWQWHKTRLRQPDRAERHWLAMAVALLWMVTLGGKQESNQPDESIGARQKPLEATPTPHPRQISCFLNGLLTVIAQLLNGQSIAFGCLFPLSFNHFNDLNFSDSS